MQFTPYRYGQEQVWKSSQGFWSFLILKSPNTGFVCSYKNLNTMEPARVFKENEEFASTQGPKSPSHLQFQTLKEAQKACDKKYKELLLR